MVDIKLKSSAFKEGELIPQKHTCDGEDVNPMLEVRNLPHETVSLALTMDDPDATRGTAWDHWLIWNIPAETQYIAEDTLPPDAVQGMNTWGKVKWSGPCPPEGAPPHRYVFTVYALDIKLDLALGSTKGELLSAMEGHVLGKAELMGKFGR
ncbi:MAG: YbhB/YbcL family Raf kinase inhibitor-like protein [bacterium]|nr:YbhB/YbcL family Raf kinase inhibitor-like protein [bacterium]